MSVFSPEQAHQRDWFLPLCDLTNNPTLIEGEQ